MSRTNGEREQDYQSRRAFHAESLVATAAYKAEKKLKQANGIPLVTYPIPAPCTCMAHEFPHYHDEKAARMEKFRFENRQAPWARWARIVPGPEANQEEEAA